MSDMVTYSLGSDGEHQQVLKVVGKTFPEAVQMMADSEMLIQRYMMSGGYRVWRRTYTELGATSIWSRIGIRWEIRVCYRK